ncbi:MAG: helix-turn-helix transcriptional regulator [Pseudomonadota bacterium]
MDGAWRIGAREVSVVEVTNNPSGAFDGPPSTEFILALVTKGCGRVEMDLGAGRFSALERPGHMNLAPPDIATSYAVDHEFDLLICGVPRAVMGEAAEALNLPIGALARLHDGLFRDETVAALARSLARAASSTEGRRADALFADQAALTLAMALLRCAGEIAVDAAPPRALSAAQLARIDAVVDEVEETRLTLADLAAVIDMPPHLFTRAFKAATGASPYHYALNRRIDRARALLTSSDAPLAEIALATGFSSQSHLSTAFKKRTGESPRAFRSRKGGS